MKWYWVGIGFILFAALLWYLVHISQPLFVDETKGEEDKDMEKYLNSAVSYALKKGIIKPVAFPTPYRITSRFGWRIRPTTKSTTKRRQFHNGIDIAVPLHTPIHAPADGIIRVKSNDPECRDKNHGGKQLLLISGRLMFGFAHLSDILAKTGQKISKGQVIARSGNTGCSTGPHLHFTIRYFTGVKWVLLDPTRFYTEIEKRRRPV